MAETYSAGIVTAYGAAVRGGYTGTYEQFCAEQAQFGVNAAKVAQDRVAVEAAAQTFTTETVPGAVQTVQQTGATQVQAVEAASETEQQQIALAGAAQETRVTQAGDDQVDAVEEAGATQVGNVNSAGTTQVGNVNSAGTTQVQAVNTAGGNQVQAVEDKGEEVLNSIPSDYTDLTEDVDNLKSAFDACEKILTADISALDNLVPFYAEAGDVLVISTLDGSPFTVSQLRLFDESKTQRTYWNIQNAASPAVKDNPATKLKTYFVSVSGGTAQAVKIANQTKLNADYDNSVCKNRIDSLESTIDDNVFYSQHVWEMGKISNGADGYNDKTLRTKGYYPTADIDYVEIIDEPYAGSIVYYEDNAGTYDGAYTSVGGANSSKIAVNKNYPYYRLQFYEITYAELPSQIYMVGYRYTTYREETDNRLVVLENDSYVATSISEFGYYRLRTNDVIRGRWFLSQGQVSRASASYRVSTSTEITLDYDVQIRCNDADFTVYGYRYISDDYGWSYFDSNAGIPIIPKNQRFVLTIQRKVEDTSEVANIQMFLSKADFYTPFALKAADIPAIDILKANEDAINKIWASRWLRSSTAKPLTLLWFSDIHRWQTPLDRIIEFKNYLTSVGILDDTIVTGDLVRNATDEATAFESFWNDTDGTDDILIALGNHDHYDVSTQPHGKASFSKMDGLFFQTVSDWDVVRESNYPFYYKDYEDQNIRLIVADPAVTSDEADETAWLQNTLAGAKTAGYAVVVASHFLVTASASIYDNDWSNNLARETGTDSMSYDWNNGCDIVGCVSDFIANGGEFICYMIGHTHTDIVSCITGHPEQLIINVACASDDRSHETSLTTNDLPRYDNSRTQDCFNVITFDATNSIIKCVRVGANVNMYQLPRTAFSYNYVTKKFISLI